MKNFSKDKIAGIVGTLLVHILVFGLLWLLVLKTAPPPPEKGIEVMMGVDIQEQAMAQVNEAPPVVVPEPAKVKPTPPAPEEPLLTQDSEESVQLPPEKPKKEKPKKKEKTPEQIQKEKEQAERVERERQEAKARKDAENLMATFNKGSKMSKKGSSDKDDKTVGSPMGNSDAGQTTGAGTGPYAKVENRTAVWIEEPIYNVQDDGLVVVDITVNPAGKVIHVEFNSRTNTANPELREAARKAALKTTFNSIDGVDNQRGTITYNFKLK